MKTRLRTDSADDIVSGRTAQEIIETLNDYIEKYEQYGPIEMVVYGLSDIEIEYRSPETKEEVNNEMSMTSFREKQEREEYERLKAKYEESK